jgi:hypothetical protein
MAPPGRKRGSIPVPDLDLLTSFPKRRATTIMLKITNAELTREVCIPKELAQSVGTFKDMLHVTVDDGGDHEPVITPLCNE